MGVEYLPGHAHDRPALVELLTGLSTASSYSRFQTAVGSTLPPALLDALLPDGVSGGTVLGWDGGRLVAHGLWVRLGPSRTAEIALVVADGHQRQGVGSALAERLLAAARARGIATIEVFSEADNLAVARMVAGRGGPVTQERDGSTVTYSFRLEGVRVPWRPRAA